MPQLKKIRRHIRFLYQTTDVFKQKHFVHVRYDHKVKR